MRPTVYLCHGFNVKSPERFFRLGSILESAGYPVVRVDYGWTGLVSVRFATEKTAQRLADTAHPYSILIGHSNGCAIGYRAMMMGAMFGQMVLINPALHRKTIFPSDTVRQIDVYYAKDDRIVTAGKWLRRLSPLRLFGKQTSWGEMGRVGAVIPQIGVFNHSLHDVLSTEESIGHGGAFRWDRLDDLARHIIERIEPCVHQPSQLDSSLAPSLASLAAS